VVGGIYSTNHQNSRWGGLLSRGAPDSPVRQPCHPTVRVLTVLTVGALTAWGNGQSGATPDRHYSLSGAPSGAALTLRELSTHCSRCRRLLESTVALLSCFSASTPDSPVVHLTVWWSTPTVTCNVNSAWIVRIESEQRQKAHRTAHRFRAALPKPEGEEFKVDQPWAPDTVRCARPGFSSVSFAPFF
jgi:hypothetical protein